MKTRLLACAALCLGPVAAAQQLLPAPLQPIRAAEDLRGAIVAQPDAALISTLAAAGDAIVLEDWFLPSGDVVNLELERISVERRRFGIQVDGQPRPDLLRGLDLSVWQGRIVGEPESSVMLGFSNHGSRGWIKRAPGSEQLLHVMPRPDADGDWTRGDVLLVSEADLVAQGNRLQFECDTLAPTREELPPINPPATSGASAGTSCTLYECTIAMETDFQLFQLWGDLNAETAYVTTLLSFISARYEEQISTTLTFPYLQFYTTANDPWTTPDNGGNSIDMLNEFVGAWQGNVPMGANLAHFMSGAGLGGGVAYLDVLCNPSFNFGVSGNINGGVNFPVMQQPNNWDFMVVSHELGHNFSSPHTHDFCPPLDECPPQQYFGQCQTQQTCSTSGTIMSYCHLCPGGTGNITTYFHPVAADVMRNGAQSCLPLYSGIAGSSADLLAPDQLATFTASIVGTPTGPVEFWFRSGSAPFVSAPMTDLGGGVFSIDVAAPPCDEPFDYYYAFDVDGCGPVTDPELAPAETYSSTVGTLVTAFADDFEQDLGWVMTNLGASTGDWERGVPVDDGSWDYDPSSDFDGSGSAWLTENQFGNTDVDAGASELVSPLLDLSVPSPVVSYAYFLRLTNSDGSDRLLVEASTTGTTGPWTEVARHDTDGGLDWRTHQITGDDFLAAGVTPGAGMALRFTINDSDPQSIVEAGLDAFAVSSLECAAEVGTRYCTSSPSSTGAPALISATGTTSVTANDLVLAAGPVPDGEPGIFYYGPGRLSLPLGSGTRCVGGFCGRLPVVTTSGGGMTSALDVTVFPHPAVQITPGSTWHFQAWFRDLAAGSSNSNLSDGLTLTFLP